MSARANLIFIILVGGAVLLCAFKWGFIGGGGAGAYRQKNAVNYWVGVGVTSVGVLFAVVMLVLSSFGILQP